jgi:copper resistance protein C
MSARAALALLLLGAPLLRPPAARAHAFLEHADPRVGSTVSAPKAVTLQFTEPVEVAFSHVEVLGPGGGPVQTGAAEHPEPDKLSVALPALAPGEYTVHWSVVSVDTHPTEGRFTFSVKAP